MAIDRSLSPLLGLPAAEEGEPLEIEFALPQQPTYSQGPDGSVVVDFNPFMMEPQVAHGDNLADYVDEAELVALAAELVGSYEADRESRADWEDAYIKGLDLLGLKFEDRTTPWDGACGVFHPMLAEAVVRFQAQTVQEVFPATGPARTNIVGSHSTERVEQSKRVEEFMNYTAINTMVEYRGETERLLFSLPLAGSAFRKVYYDPSMGRPCSMFVPAEDFVVSYGASDLATCERATHVMKRTANQVRKLQVSGFYRDIDLPTPSPTFSDVETTYQDLTGHTANYDTDQRHTLLEMHVDVDLVGFEDQIDGEPTGIALPYVITIDKSSRTILSIYRNWDENDPNKNRRQHFVHYQYLPGLGFYGFGLVHIIGGLSKSATSLLRQLVDSGTLANLPGGLKTRGLRIKGDDTPIMPGEFRDVDVPSGSIRDNISFLPYKEPSTVLYQLLGDIVQEGRRFASAADVKAADINGEAPVGTTLAILEREMKVLSAVQARVHAAMGKELRLLANIIKDHGPEEYPYEIEGNFTVAQDFDERVDVIPVSDPNAGTMAQRIMQYQAALQLAAQAPNMYDLPHLHRQMLETLNIRDTDKIVPMEEDLLPMDPVSENMAILKGEPIRAFLHQDHEAHIQTHLSAAKHPEIIGLLKDNPQAKALKAAMDAHIAEHIGMAYREQLERELGVRLPDPDQSLPHDIEVRLSRLVAPAADQLTGKAQQRRQAEENARLQEDPIIQMQQKELAIKEAKVKADADDKKRRSQLDAQKLQTQAKLDAAKLLASLAEAQMKADSDKKKNLSAEQREGYRMGLDFAKSLIEQHNRPDKKS